VERVDENEQMFGVEQRFFPVPVTELVLPPETERERERDLRHSDIYVLLVHCPTTNPPMIGRGRTIMDL